MATGNKRRMVDPFLKEARSLNRAKTINAGISIGRRAGCYELLPTAQLRGISERVRYPMPYLGDKTPFSRLSAYRSYLTRFVLATERRTSRPQEGGAMRPYTDSAALGDASVVEVCIADVHNQGGLALCRAGDNTGALAEFDRAIQADPSLAEAYNNRGAIRLALGDTKGAFTDYSAALSLKPNYAEVFNNRGAARQSLGDMDGALADYDRAVALKPN
jgi:tetratricopeptide (TPR) repeat protein